MKPPIQILTVWLMLCCVGVGLAAYIVGCPHHVWFWAALSILVFVGSPLWVGGGTDAAPATRPVEEAIPLGAPIPVRWPKPASINDNPNPPPPGPPPKVQLRPTEAPQEVG